MAHAHDHSHGGHRLEQICTLIICGLLGLVCILLYQKNALDLILAKQFHVPVLLGGIALLALVGVSAVMNLIASKSQSHGGEACAGHEHCDHDHGETGHEHHDHDHGHAHSHVHTHDHAHEGGHEHSCGHDHGHEHAHDHVHDDELPHGAALAHDHGHDHGWNPWRYIVLLLPVVLYFLNLPNGGFSAGYMTRNMNTGELDSTSVSGRIVENAGMRIDKTAGQEYPTIVGLSEGGPAEKAGLKLRDTLVSLTRTTDADGKALPKPETIDLNGLAIEDAVNKLTGKPQTSFKVSVEKEGADKQTVEVTRTADVIDLGFLELNDAALSSERRAYYAGKMGRLKGQFLPGSNDRMFSLARIRIRCCAADTSTLNVIIILDNQVPSGALSAFVPQQWVQVTGEIQFRKRKDRDEYATVMVVSKASDIKKTDPDPDLYLTN